MSSDAFTDAQTTIVTGPGVRAILGEEVADRVRERFADQRPDADGYVYVDLGEDRRAVVAALREISPDASEPADQQATETLLKALADGD